MIYDPDADRRSMPRSAPPTSTTSPRPRRCRSSRARPMSSTRLLRFCLVGQARRRRLPHRHPVQDQYAAQGGRGTAAARGRQHPLRPHRPSARAPSHSRQNPFQDPCAKFASRPRPARCCASVTNDLDASAQEIADLYKRRWAIELFFRWVKQTLRIPHFLGTTENAVRIQIAVALIAFLLLRLAQAIQRP